MHKQSSVDSILDEVDIAGKNPVTPHSIVYTGRDILGVQKCKDIGDDPMGAEGRLPSGYIQLIRFLAPNGHSSRRWLSTYRSSAHA